MSKYAGPLQPFAVGSSTGRPQPNRVVTFRYGANGEPAPIYLDRDRTPATEVVSDEYGNVSGYFAEPGFYIASAGDLPEIDVMALLDNSEIMELAGTTPGPRGEQGQTGPNGEHAPRRFYGEGPPGTLIGAQPKDEYLDVQSGNLYVLS